MEIASIARVSTVSIATASAPTSASAPQMPQQVGAKVSSLVVGQARGNANISELAGIYVAHAPGPPPISVGGSSPSEVMGKLELMVDIFA